MPSASFTTLSLKPSTLRRLRAYKVDGMTYDDVLNELMEEQPTPAFWEEHARRMKEESIPWENVKKELGLDRPGSSASRKAPRKT